MRDEIPVKETAAAAVVRYFNIQFTAAELVSNLFVFLEIKF